MMKTPILITFLVLLAVVSDIGARKLSRSRSSGSGRSSGRKTNQQPAPTSLSYPQPSAQKPSLFGWQEKPAQKPNTQAHSYPSSHTGLSGNKPSSNQENIQKSYVPVQQSAPQSQQNSHSGHSYPVSNGLSGSSSSGGGSSQPKQPPSYQESVQRSSVQQSAPQSQQNSHSYPVSNGLSGSSSSGAGYPQGQGLSGHNAAPPPYQGLNTANYNKPQGAGNYPTANAGNNYNHAAPPPYASGGNGYYHPHSQGPPPPYSSGHGYGGYGGPGPYSPQAPGYFGNYANSGRGFGSVGRTGSALTGVGIAGAGIGTVLTGLALWNLARSTGSHHHTVIYDNRGQPIAVAPDNSTAPAVDPILGDLVNCTLTIDNENATEIIAIPCSIATSFTPDADVKDVSVNNQTNDKTKCTITVVTKAGKEFMTTIPCSVLLNTAAENNVTEPAILDDPTKIENGTVPENNTLIYSDQPTALRFSTTDENPKYEETDFNCTQEEGEIRDPINPCFSVKHNLTVIPLHTTEHIMQT
ncbi:trithorax group protein osa-like isoform X1 [Maniola jurtina]|uniref:trithorax group protein osa-like isoform X1 n=1 Tax=Maniola jurtina TaxID=191418 RepID=UPI001E68AD9D|nr:trithorax group protein osa-like isoform X1 [Maniola jurtina]